MDSGQGEATAVAAAAPGSAATTAPHGEAGPGGQEGQQRRDTNRLEPAQEAPLTDIAKLRITLLRNVRYHEDREGYFGCTNRAMSFGVVMTGTAAFAAFSRDRAAGWGVAISVLTSAIGAIQLVFRRTTQEHLHASMRKSFLGLLAELNDSNVAAIRTKADLLYRDELPTFYACDAIAFNAAQRALGRKTYLVVPWWARCVRHWWRFTDWDFKEEQRP